MEYFIVHCEFRGDRRRTVEVPASLLRTVVNGVDVTAMLACEQAEREASESFGGTLSDWFAWKIIPDTE